MTDSIRGRSKPLDRRLIQKSLLHFNSKLFIFRTFSFFSASFIKKHSDYFNYHCVHPMNYDGQVIYHFDHFCVCLWKKGIYRYHLHGKSTDENRQCFHCNTRSTWSRLYEESVLSSSWIVYCSIVSGWRWRTRSLRVRFQHKNLAHKSHGLLFTRILQASLSVFSTCFAQLLIIIIILVWNKKRKKNWC